jgi:3-deoxy-D-manno-octulosonic-acid transferase
LKQFLVTQIYSIGIRLYYCLIYVASRWKQKAKLWVEGRKNWQAELQKHSFGNNVLWIHASSVGEFEQGRPIIESLKSSHPSLQVVLTFFSPSGYEYYKDYPLAEYICSLPQDTPKNAQIWLQAIQPKLVIFVKYDFWLHFLLAIKKEKIPLILVSAIAHPNMFTGLKKHFYELAFSTFSHIFVQSKDDLARIAALYPPECLTISGDTRADQVVQRSQQITEIRGLYELIGHRFCFIAGSMWQQDLNVLIPAMQQFQSENIVWIIVLHELEPNKLNQLQNQLEEKGFKSIRWTTVEQSAGNVNPSKYHDCNAIIFDKMGLLFQLYHYADLVFVGGGFSTGIHNILEPLVWGKKVVFGPHHQKFKEAQDVIHHKLGACINSDNDLVAQISTTLASNQPRPIVDPAAIDYVTNSSGAKAVVLNWIYTQNILKI